MTDARNGTTVYTYTPDDQPATIITPDPDGAGPQLAQTTQYFYDAAGRKWKEVQPDNGIIFTEYWPTGALKKTYSARTYPVEYTYDPQGRLKTLTTWKDFHGQSGAAVTTWHYFADSGLLEWKEYSNGQGTHYTYTPAGRLATRTWARGIVTTYGKNNAGEIDSITYSDGTTPGVGLTFNRRGLPATVDDASGHRELTYTADGQPDDESYTTGLLAGILVDHHHDALLRRDELKVKRNGTAFYEVDYGYDQASRLQTVSSGANSATYGRATDSELIETVSFAHNSQPVMTTTKTYDKLQRLESTVSRNAQSVVLSSWGYEHNAANQRTKATTEDGSYWKYSYDALGQVTSGSKRWSDHSEVAGSQFGYHFDDIGNRTSTVTNGRSATYTANLLNQYENRTVPGPSTSRAARRAMQR